MDHSELIARLLHLVSLNEPKNGGPYQGFAAAECMKAMIESAAALRNLPEPYAESLQRVVTIYERTNLFNGTAERKFAAALLPAYLEARKQLEKQGRAAMKRMLGGQHG